MPFFNRFSNKSKEANQHQIPRSSDDAHEKSEKELLTQVGHLQMEMSRLNQQLSSIHVQAQAQFARGKEDLSAQRSQQTFSTKGTTQPNHSSGSYPRLCVDRLESSTGTHTVKPVTGMHREYNPRDCPPPVSQIFIPTPLMDNERLERSCHNGNTNRRSPTYTETCESHKTNRSTEKEQGGSGRGRQQYIRGGVGTAKVGVPEQRPKTRSWRSSHSTPSNHSHGSKNSLGRVRFRTVKRIPTESPSSSSTPFSQCQVTREKNSRHKFELARDSEEFNRRVIIAMEDTQSKKKRQHIRPPSSDSRDNICPVWQSVQDSERFNVPMSNQPRHTHKESSHGYNVNSVKRDQLYQTSQEQFKEKEFTKLQQNHHLNRRSPKDSSQFGASNQLSNHCLSRNSNQDKKLLLSEIQEQRFNLKSANERPKNPPLSNLNDDMGLMFAAIQKGVALKHIDDRTKYKKEKQVSPTNAMLLQLQERKKEYMRNERTK